MYHDPNPFNIDPTWQHGLQRGDIVLFRFPIAEQGDATPKLRPCLVLEAGAFKNSRLVTLAYGTSARTPANRGYSVIVKRAAAMTAAGLTKPTRLVGARRITVSVDNPGFEPHRNSATPHIGRLDGPLLDRMDKIRARICAEADIAAENRRNEDEERRQWQREERGFSERNRALCAAITQNKGTANV